jgi:hypothetical protein
VLCLSGSGSNRATKLTPVGMMHPAPGGSNISKITSRCVVATPRFGSVLLDHSSDMENVHPSGALFEGRPSRAKKYIILVT